MIGSDGFCCMNQSICHLCSLSDGFFIQVERGEVGLLVLEVGLEHDDWELSSEVGLPGVGVLHGNEIDFVENDNDFLVRHGLDFPLDVLASTSQRVSCV